MLDLLKDLLKLIWRRLVMELREPEMFEGEFTLDISMSRGTDPTEVWRSMRDLSGGSLPLIFWWSLSKVLFPMGVLRGSWHCVTGAMGLGLYLR